MNIPGYDAWKTRSPYDEPGYYGEESEDEEPDRVELEPCPACDGRREDWLCHVCGGWGDLYCAGDPIEIDEFEEAFGP